MGRRPDFTTGPLDLRKARRYLAYVMDERLDELVEQSIKNIGKLLAEHRWKHSTPEQRAEQARKMVAGRKLKKGKKR